MRVVRLDTVCSITMGQAPSGDTYNDRRLGLPLIAGAGDFGSDGPAPKKHTTASGIRSAEAGDVILGIRASIGAKVLADRPYCLGRGVAGLRAGAGLYPRFLWHWLDLARPDLVRKGRGATFLQVNKGDVGSLGIPLPPIEEQRRIAAVLDAADALRAKRREAIAKLDSLTQAIFIDMFRKQGWGAFDRVTVEEASAKKPGAIRTGPFGSQLLHEEFVDAGVAVLGIDNAVNNKFGWAQRRFITERKYQELRRYTVFPGDVLVTIMGTCGRVAVVPDDIPVAINTKHLCCITLDRNVCLPGWLWAALRFHPDVRRDLGATHGAVMPGLNMGRIKRATIPLPPLDVQRQFLSRTAATERLLSSARQSLIEVDTLFASLQQRAFRGEL